MRFIHAVFADSAITIAAACPFFVTVSSAMFTLPAATLTASA